MSPCNKNTRQTKSTFLSFLLLLCLPVFCFSQIEISTSLDNDQPGIYGTFELTITATNNSTTADAMSTSVRYFGCNNQGGPLFDQSFGIVYDGTPDDVPSVGTFDFVARNWFIPTLAPGQSSSLKIKFFALTDDTRNLIISTQRGSGGDCAASRSGEAIVEVNGDGGGGKLPDLNLARLLNLPNAADPGDVVSFNFDLINSGESLVADDYTVGAYLSGDSNFGNGDDVRVGEVVTGNTPVGTIANVEGAITIPGNLATGSYFLILVADDGEVITEVDESNNFLSGNIFVNDVIGCGKVIFNEPTFSCSDGSPAEVRITWSEVPGADAYQVLLFSRADNVLIKEELISLDTRPGLPLNEFIFAGFQLNTGYLIQVATVCGDQSSTFVATTFDSPSGCFDFSGSFNEVVYNPETTALAASLKIGHMNIAETTVDVNFYFSTSGLFGDGLIFNASRKVMLPGCNTDQCSSIANLFTTVPGTLLSGEYYLVAVIDPINIIDEVDETNNFVASLNRINVDNGNDEKPTVNLITPSLTVEGPFNVSVQFSDSVTDFTLAEIVVTNGTKSNAAQQSGSSYSFTVTPIAEGDVTVFVPADAAFDGDGNGNQSSNTLSVTFDTGGGGEELDLELSVSAPNTNPAQYDFFTSVFTLTNEGTNPADNIQLTWRLGNGGFVPRGGMESTVSQGSAVGRLWNVGSLDAGESAAITLEFFNLEENAKFVWAEVFAQSGSDVDSAPNNGIFGEVNEDDEALIAFNDDSGGDAFDLEMTNLAAPDEIEFNFVAALITVGQVTNVGTAAAPASTIRVYISKDDQFDPAEDAFFAQAFIGALEPGEDQLNAPQIDDLILEGSFNLDRNHPENYWIAVLSTNDGVEEENESNNIFTKPFTVVVPDYDVEVKANVAPPTVVEAGQEYDLDFSVINNGSQSYSITIFDKGGSASSVLDIATSPDLTTPAVANLFQSPWSFLPFSSPDEMLIPADLPDGDYYLRWYVASNLTEVTKENNVLTFPITVGSGGGDLSINCPDDIVADFSACYIRDPRGPNLPIETTALIVPTSGTSCPGGVVSVELVPNPDVVEPGGMFNFYYITGQGNYTVEWKVTDECGNEEICAYEVTIIGRPFPVSQATCPDNITVEIAEGIGGAVVNYDAPVIDQNCCNPNEGFIELVEGLESGSFFPVGTTTQNFSGFVNCTQFSIGCSFTITVDEVTDPGGDECGFDQNYNLVNGSTEIEVRATETNNGYVVRQLAGNFGNTNYSIINYGIDQQGDPVNIAGQVMAAGQWSLDGTSVYDIMSVADLEYELRRINFDGSPLSSTAFTLIPPDTEVDYDITSINVLEGEDAFFVFNIFINTTNGRQYPNLVKINKAGNIVFQKLLPEVENFTLGSVRLIGQDGSIYVRYDLPGRVGNITKYDANGNFVAVLDSQGDLVSSRLFDPVESSDGQFIYIPFYTDPIPELGKYNASTGEEIYRINLSNVLSPNVLSFFGRNTSVLPLENGEAIVGYSFSDPSSNQSGYEYGKLDAGGNLIWRQELADSYTLKPVLATSDGGYLFFGKNSGVTSGGTVTIVKTTSEGLLTPDCNPILENSIDLELSLSANPVNPGIYGNVGITATVTNNGPDDANDVRILLGGCRITNGNFDRVLFFNGSGLVYATPEHTATAGDYAAVNQLWIIPTLAAGQTATLDITIFTLTNEPRDVVAYVVNALGEDVDSSPGFGFSTNTCEPGEDDEAKIVINGSTAPVQSRSSIEEDFGITQTLHYKIHKTFPTLTENEVNVLLFSKKETHMDMVIYDMQGKEVQQKKIDITKGPNQIRLDVSELTSGMHNIMFTPKEGVRGKPLTTRFVKQKL